MSITRRLFLRNTAAAGAVAATVTAPTAAAVEPVTVAVKPTIDELIEHHQAGLKAALESKYGEKGWRMWAVGPQGIAGPSVFFNVDNTNFTDAPDPKNGGAA